MPRPDQPIPQYDFSGRSHSHDDSDDEDNRQHHIDGTNNARPMRYLTMDQRHKEKLRLYQAQRNGNWLTLQNQLELPSTKNFDVDEYGNVEWVRRKDGWRIWLMKLDALGQQGCAKVWFILKDPYMEC